MAFAGLLLAFGAACASEVVSVERAEQDDVPPEALSEPARRDVSVEADADPLEALTEWVERTYPGLFGGGPPVGFTYGCFIGGGVMFEFPPRAAGKDVVTIDVIQCRELKRRGRWSCRGPFGYREIRTADGFGAHFEDMPAEEARRIFAQAMRLLDSGAGYYRGDFDNSALGPPRLSRLRRPDRCQEGATHVLDGDNLASMVAICIRDAPDGWARFVESWGIEDATCWGDPRP